MDAELHDWTSSYCLSFVLSGICVFGICKGHIKFHNLWRVNIFMHTEIQMDINTEEDETERKLGFLDETLKAWVKV